MSLETWAAFAAAAIALLLIPGPTILLVIGPSRGAVRRPALRRGRDRLGGSLLIGAGLATAALRRA
ncbi:hypothetical protein [Roseicella sp. DB1501]|uniref:hypothetical protein n=1 Tax=Roseicella sp. DB1501 TaxID=2730925 RepID=UPI001C2C614E|nr:hypothetical protein [Roseicella sp. DB1501]